MQNLHLKVSNEVFKLVKCSDSTEIMYLLYVGQKCKFRDFCTEGTLSCVIRIRKLVTHSPVDCEVNASRYEG